SKKSYHSIVVPTVLAISARRNCALCSVSDNPLIGISTAVIASPPEFSVTPRNLGFHFSAIIGFVAQVSNASKIPVQAAARPSNHRSLLVCEDANLVVADREGVRRIVW